MRLIDTACAGIAKGVGTAKILGRVHSAPLKVADLYLPCSFTVMEVRCYLPTRHPLSINPRAHQGRDVDLLLGLDMLKAHQACIDLEKNVLRIQGREIKFLAEHELHDKARMMNSGEHADSSLDSNEPSSSSSSSVPGGAPLAFPGSGQTLGAAPRAGGVGASSYPEEAIQTLLGLGVTRDEAIRSLELAGGNVDIAASLFF
jgi:DNA damage-inducible protein 1